jgi:ADP-ribosylglycohydrolase
MFISAMLAATAFTNNVEELIQYGLSQIPEKSRFTEAVNSTIAWKKQGLNWEQAIDRIHKMYNEKEEYDSLYVLPNAMIVCTGLLYGEMDFEKSIGTAVTGSFDRDCNGATVGSIVGMVLGASALPEKWIKPLNDRVKSGIDGFGMEKISDLAWRTVKVINKL